MFRICSSIGTSESRRRIRPWLGIALLTIVGCSERPLTCQISPNVVDNDAATSPIHDPSIEHFDDRYYVYSSSALGSFYQSADLTNWQASGAVFDAMPDWLLRELPEADHIGAPDISYYQGRYLLFYQSHISDTCNAATGLASNAVLDPEHPDYAWVDHGLILRSKPFYDDVPIYCGNDDATFNAIDAQFFVDEENIPWLVFGSTIGGIKLIQLDPKTLKPADDAAYTTLAQRWLLQEDPIIEAPFITFRDGYYYLFMSFNHCCIYDDTSYQMRFGRSKEVTGPYIDQQGWPLYLGGGSLLIATDPPFVATGHGDIMQADDRHWLVHHAKLPAKNHLAHLQIRALNWTEDQWPTVCQP